MEFAEAPSPVLVLWAFVSACLLSGLPNAGFDVEFDGVALAAGFGDVELVDFTSDFVPAALVSAEGFFASRSMVAGFLAREPVLRVVVDLGLEAMVGSYSLRGLDRHLALDYPKLTLGHIFVRAFDIKHSRFPEGERSWTFRQDALKHRLLAMDNST